MSKHPGQLTPENLTGLPKYTAYTRLLIDGLPSGPFSMVTLSPTGEGIDLERAAVIQKVMAKRFEMDAVPARNLSTTAFIGDRMGA